MTTFKDSCHSANIGKLVVNSSPKPFYRYVDELIKYELDVALRKGMDRFLGMMDVVKIPK